MSKTAIVVLSDPNNGEEALGRLFNALFLAFERQEKGQETALIFQGAGVRWAPLVVKDDHPAHGLFAAVSGLLAGVCGGCADVFGASEDVQRAGLSLVRETEIPGAGGIIDLSGYLDRGYQLLTF